MNNNVEAAKKMAEAWEIKDEELMRSFLHEDYLCVSPGEDMNGDQLVDFMKNCPFEGKCENHELIAEGDKVVGIFDWVVTAPFQATIPMVEIMEFENGKLRKSRMFYDRSLFPAEFADVA